MQQKSILFVFNHEQQSVLDSIKQILNRRQNEWAITFAGDSQEALEVLRQQEIDVIVTDMELDRISGLELLRKVENHWPGTVRFILSTEQDRKVVLQYLGVAHRSITKPCRPEELRQLLNTSLGLRDILGNQELHARIATIGTLPSPPELYHRLMQELQDDNASLTQVADLVCQDVALTAKILQMINSAFFGLPRRVESVTQAVNYLGLEAIKALVLAAGTFAQFEVQPVTGVSVESIYDHSLAVGSLARKIARKIGLTRMQADEALMAGMLHDIGKLVMLAHLREDLARAVRIAEENQLPLYEAEREVLRVTHAEIGAHLLSLWGLPDAILEPVALHHDPLRMPCPERTPLTAVHIANALQNEIETPDGTVDNPVLNIDYCRQTFLLDDLPALRGLNSVEAAPAV